MIFAVDSLNKRIQTFNCRSGFILEHKCNDEMNMTNIIIKMIIFMLMIG